jgi:hypothetical protein
MGALGQCAGLARHVSVVQIPLVSQPGAEFEPEHDDETAEASAETLGRLAARVAQAEFERDLARTIQRRLEGELRRLESRVGVLEGERANLRAQLDERDRLLGVIFRSRSWRIAQRLRRLLGRE